MEEWDATKKTDLHSDKLEQVLRSRRLAQAKLDTTDDFDVDYHQTEVKHAKDSPVLPAAVESPAWSSPSASPALSFKSSISITTAASNLRLQ